MFSQPLSLVRVLVLGIPGILCFGGPVPQFLLLSTALFGELPEGSKRNRSRSSKASLSPRRRAPRGCTSGHGSQRLGFEGIGMSAGPQKIRQ